MPPKPTTAVLNGPFAGTVGQPVVADPTPSKAAPGATLKSGSIGWGDGDTTQWMGRPALESHVYQKAGTFTVVLTVWDTKGKTATATKTATIAAAPPIPVPDPTPIPTPDPTPTPDPIPVPIPQPSPSDALSPTGRAPLLWWTPARQGVYNRMWAEYQANPSAPTTLDGQWMQHIVQTVAAGGGLTGAGAMAFLFQVTGDVAYAQAAYAQSQSDFFQYAPGFNGDDNFVREQFLRLVVWYDWIFPGLTAAQRANYLAKLNDLEAFALRQTVRTSDSDQTIGVYFGVVAMKLVTGAYNPPAVTYFNQPQVGGLTPTASDLTTLRNAVKKLVSECAAGGEWMESTEYNLGTTRLVLEGAEAIKTATGIDYFPEITAWAQDWALRLIYHTSPDLNEEYQWGDVQAPRGMIIYDYVWNVGTVAGLLQGTPNGPAIQDRLLAAVAKWPLTTYNNVRSAIMIVPGMCFVNPYAPRGDSHTLPQGRFEQGQGLQLYHDGWELTDSFFGAHMPHWTAPLVFGTNILPFVDHSCFFFGNFQLYRHGAWALTHPISYGGAPSNSGHGVNGFQFYGGLSSVPKEYKKVRAHEVGAAPDYAYLSGTVGGNMENEDSYDPPPTWLQEATRSLLYLPSSDKQSDTILVFDRFHALRPQDLNNGNDWTFYYNAEKQAAINANARREVIFHMPVSPTTGSEISWTTAGGDQAVISTLLPTLQTRTVHDERVLYADGTVSAAEEKKFQVRLKANVDRPFETFLNVVQVHDGIVRSNTLVESADHAVQGCVVHRAGLNDVLALFNATPGPAIASITLNGSIRSVYAAGNPAMLDRVRLRTTGYSVSVTQGTPTLDAFLFDLDPGKPWTIQVDGASAVALTVSSQGVARHVVTGTGSHTLVIT